MTYLITGATGDIGSRIVERLLKRGDRPRIFVRNREKARARYGDRVDIAVGDLASEETLRTALEGVEALFLVNCGPELAGRDGAAAIVAKAAGVKRLIKLSSLDAEQEVGTGIWHARGEAAIRESGLIFTFVRPSGFMSNALGWAPSIEAEGVVRAPTGDGKIAFIHPEDIAAVAIEALTTREFDRKSLPITGPEPLSYAEMISKIAVAAGKPLRFQSTTDEQEGRHMIESGCPPEIVDAHLSIYRAIREGRLAIVTDNVNRILRQVPISFDQWANENAGAFCQ
jgi:uncharacterized protein YbjT (DUF2867 family)